MGVDINDEVRVKMWVANNINTKYSEPSTIKDENGFIKNFSFPTHYGHIKTLDADGVLNYLRRGATFVSKVQGPQGILGGKESSSTKTSFFKDYSNETLFPNGDIKPKP